MSSFTRAFLRHIELWLSAVGVILIIVIPTVFGSGIAFWKIMAITAAAVGVVHGLIFWFVRRRQRRIREQAVKDIREMLTDRVLNHLSIIRMSLPEEAEDADFQGHMDEVERSVEEIAQMVDSISEESLQDWRTRYADSAGSALDA